MLVNAFAVGLCSRSTGFGAKARLVHTKARFSPYGGSSGTWLGRVEEAGCYRLLVMVADYQIDAHHRELVFALFITVRHIHGSTAGSPIC